MFIGLASVKPQVGKSTVANYLMERHRFCGTECSDPVVYIAKKYFGFNGNKHNPQQRLILQKVGLMGKEIEPTLWLYYSLMFNGPSPPYTFMDWEKYTNFKKKCLSDGVERTLGYPSIYIGGVRSPDEADEVLKLGGQVWLVRRKAVENSEVSKHKVENQLSSYDKFTAIINNDGTINELYQKVEELLCSQSSLKE